MFAATWRANVNKLLESFENGKCCRSGFCLYGSSPIVATVGSVFYINFLFSPNSSTKGNQL
ncbi:hypothetical protein EIKCOROL_01777 [Eikenella corrodens ATCC 23834]|uniref:Uncharacterized protein n=1 Tax=Eikenella corrodens ATCC 23834 TaxID=546274 RepID=C0DWM5_EIKCO|nr:hypothetical protein EIKCOROL_01777 [Eikenella corrodens ATCC 23834]